ncbi:unnamed protein product [Nyctereutes procyonoides]|uniref:Large ribosomal subunit protein bL36m n=1 Tax=Nyctereutes procyonoides TaxID=34880 RepID=A0A811YBK2_NYCPR|nr:unnamed protein product [Nyctereutes procyonoides]
MVEQKAKGSPFSCWDPRSCIPNWQSPAPHRGGLAALSLPSCLPRCLQPALGFKAKSRIKEPHGDSHQVKRHRRWFIYCRTNPKHKHRQL